VTEETAVETVLAGMVETEEMGVLVGTAEMV